MSDTFDASDDAQNDNIRELREQAKQARDLAAERDKLQRELAFSRAGVDMSDPKLSYFVKGYEGELTPEAIKAEAAAAGFLSTEPSQPPVQPAIPEDEQAALMRTAMAAMQGGVAPDLVSPPGQDEELRDLIRSRTITTPDQIGEFLASKGQPVAWDGPQGGDNPQPWTSMGR